MSNFMGRITVLTLCLTLVALMAAVNAQAADTRSVSVQLTEPFVVNGRAFEPETLVVRQIERLSPVTTLHEIWVGEQCLGMVMARVISSQESEGLDHLIFSRDASGVLRLEALALRGGPVRELQPFQPVAPGTSYGAQTAAFLR